MAFLDKLLGDPNKRVIKQLQPIVDKINSLESEFEQLSDDSLRSKTEEYISRLQAGETLDDILPEAFATVREAAKRTLGQRHHDVQLIGGIVLHRGEIAEMKTGEGKTLTSTLPVYLNALTKKGVHVITVNDYLARRDAIWMGQVYHALGLTVGSVNPQSSCLYDPEFLGEEALDEKRDESASYLVHEQYLRPVEKREAYGADITYGTNNEFGFDYLRDNMVTTSEQMVQRGLHFTIIDEVDSVLIDEARTPLIISAPAEDSSSKYFQFAQLVKQLKENDHYNIDEKMKTATLNEAGISKMEQLLGVENIYTEAGISTVHHIEQALRAETMYKKDVDYVVKEGEIIIIDEFTGRMMHGRRFSEGLHQAIEAKEGVEVKQESRTMATITFQNYFRMYEKLAGMTGTAATEAEEFSKIYNIEVVVIPTNKPVIRKDLNDRIYKTEKGKFMAVVKDVKELHEKGQPVLIGTISIEKSEILSDFLLKNGVPHEVLNAKQHQREAEIVAQAGRKGAVTIATNMAGRGVDIMLGGQPFDQKAHDEIRELGGLAVIGTERHESRRIDNQLRGRSGRQGEEGMTRFYVSLEDDLMRIFGSDRMQNLMGRLNMAEDMPIESKMVSKALESAQKRVEGHNFDIRKRLVEYDDVVNKQRDSIYTRRKEILDIADGKEESVTLKTRIMELVNGEIEKIVSFHTASDKPKEWNCQEILEDMNTIFTLPQESKDEIEKFREQGGRHEMAKAKTGMAQYFEELAQAQYKGLETQVTENIPQENAMQDLEKYIILRAIDTMWIEHLEALRHLRTGIGLRGYGQRDPLIEYKREAYSMFLELNNLIDRQIVYSIFKVGVAQVDTAKQQNILRQAQYKGADSNQHSLAHAGNVAHSVVEHAAVEEKMKDGEGNKVGRNDPCPCGSGKKYKKCHGA